MENKKPMTKNKNVIFVECVIDDNIEKEIRDDVIDTIVNTRFNKISIPVNMYRAKLSEEQDDRLYVVGYIANYNKDNNLFRVVLYNGYSEKIKGFKDLYMTVTYNKNGVITKFILDTK